MGFGFFFKQKTAYEIRKGDWSSDVCSSDLTGLDQPARQGEAEAGSLVGTVESAVELLELHEEAAEVLLLDSGAVVLHLDADARRGELERVGEIVVEHLFQPARVDEHAIAQRGIDHHLDVHALRGRE